MPDFSVWCVNSEKGEAIMKSTKEFSLCNAMKNNMSRTWQKTLAVLVAMVVFTISPVITVMAAARQVNITVDGKTSAGMITMACENEDDARAILAQHGYEVSEQDLVSFSEGEGAAVSIQVRSALSTTVSADGREAKVTVYYGDTVAEALSAAGVSLKEFDTVTPGKTNILTGNETIAVKRYHDVTVLFDGTRKTVVVPDGTVADALKAAGVTLGGEDVATPAPEAALVNDMQVTVQRVSYQEVTTTEAVAFETVKKEDSSMTKGATKVETEGREGVRTIVTREKWVDGERVETEEISNEITQEPVAKVVRVGTKPRVAGQAIVGGNGTLIDQNGNPVSYSKVITGKCSAYTGGGYCSTGAPAAFGRVAVNPNVIPYGTRLYICSPDGRIVYGYAVAADTGGACMRGTIVCDLYYDTLSECAQIGVRNMNIYILG